MNETKSPGAICASWWHRNVGNDDGAARMTRARLHRCSTPAEALCIEAVHRLNAQLRAAGYHPGADRLALVAIVLALWRKVEAVNSPKHSARADRRMAPVHSVHYVSRPSFEQPAMRTLSLLCAGRWPSCGRRPLISSHWPPTSIAGMRTLGQRGVSSILARLPAPRTDFRGRPKHDPFHPVAFSDSLSSLQPQPR